MGTALVTGAARGIGWSFSKRFAADGHDLVLVDVDKKQLEESANILTDLYGTKIKLIVKDLTKFNSSWDVFAETSRHSIQVDYLVNNAGFGTYGKFQDTDRYKTEKMLYLNICTLTNLTHLFVKKMIEQGSGKILNVSSTSAFQPMPYMAAYGASKSYVYYFSQALRENLKGTGVTVTTLCPGPTKTAFWDIASTEKSWLFKIMKPLPVEEVVRQGYLGLMKGKRLVIPGWRHRAVAFLARIDVLNIATKATDWLQKERFNEAKK